ncbi:MAG: hypothetical protein LBU57_04390 [Dysgonamonadaceae bacterium]|nr:hypothetical protein [Dysgonamonadaceae bacterium]
MRRSFLSGATFMRMKENYLYAKDKGMETYIKYNSFHKEQTRKQPHLLRLFLFTTKLPDVIFCVDF